MAKGTADGGATAGTDQEKASSGGKGGGDVLTMPATDEELVIRAPVHCDGCGRKLRRSLQRLEGVEEVTVNGRTNTVVVRGRRAVENTTEVIEVVERKTGEKAVLVSSPSPDKLMPRSAKGGQHEGKKNDDDANTKGRMSNESSLPEMDMKMVTVLKINLHCDACCEEIKRRILKITGVEDAVPDLKSSQMMVKGKVEPATLVGFIHKRTGRKAAIIRAEPLDDLLLRSPNSPAAPMVVVATPPPDKAESKKDEPPDLAGEKKKNGRQNENGRKEEANEENSKKNEENIRGQGGKDHKNTNPASDSHGAVEEHGGHGGEAPDHDGDGLVLEKENHTKEDHLFTVPMPAGVVTVVAPEMALSNRSYCYPAYPPYAQRYYPYHQQYYQYQQYPYPQAYPAYASSPAMYMYYGYPPEDFSEENPNACTIV